MSWDSPRRRRPRFFVGATESDLTGKSIPDDFGDSYGMLKLLVSTEDHQLLGVHIFDTAATDLVHIEQAVMECGGAVEYLVDAVLND